MYAHVYAVLIHQNVKKFNLKESLKDAYAYCARAARCKHFSKFYKITTVSTSIK